MLCSPPEVADLAIGGGQFDVTCYLDFSLNIGKEAVQEEMRDYGYTWEGMLPLEKRWH